MGIDAAFMVNKGLVDRLVTVDPVTDEGAQLGMVRVRAIELVREGTEETVAVAEGGSSIEAEQAELVVELLCVVGRVAEGEELGTSAGQQRRKCRRTFPREDRVVRVEGPMLM